MKQFYRVLELVPGYLTSDKIPGLTMKNLFALHDERFETKDQAVKFAIDTCNRTYFIIKVYDYGRGCLDLEDLKWKNDESA